MSSFYLTKRLGFLLAFGTLAVGAQGIQTSEISGEVKDAQGQPQENARVLLESPALQGQRSFSSDAKGRFSARLLPPGEYVITVAKDGFQTLKARQKLALGQSYSPRYTLQPVGNAIVEVSATLAQLDTTTVGSSSNYQMDQMENLPIQRMPENMLTLTPGVVDKGTTTGFSQIRGALSSNNKFLIDGQDVNDPVYGNRSVSVIDDAIQEVQVITGAISAEYGDVDGGVVNTITKTGGNEFTGTLRFSAHNDAWNAVQPMQNRSKIVNKLNYDERFSLGGFLIKDKLWFFVSGFQQNLSESRAIHKGPYANTAYAYGLHDRRMQTKLTWQATQDHSLSLAYLTQRETLTNRDFMSGDLTALEPQLDQNSAWSLTWLANWRANLSMEARLGGKRAGLTTGGTLPGVTPVYDAELNRFFGNGCFNAMDGGDHRDNRNADVKFTLLWDSAGSHEMAFGLNFMRGIRRAQNQQTPTNARIQVNGFEPFNPAQATRSTSVETLPVYQQWFSTEGRAYDTTTGLYVNDKWVVNPHLSFNLGLRWDHYHADSDDTGSTAGASGWSPRLGLKYDLFADAKWQAAVSFSRYNSAPLASIVNAVSNVGNPTEVDYRYTGPQDSNGAITQSDLTRFQNYGIQLNYISPLTTVLPPHLRTPHTNEYQASLAHAFKVLDREAYLKLTLVQRDFQDLFDYRAGNDGVVTPPSPFDRVGPQYLKIWENSGLAKRRYRDAELEGGYQGDSLNLTGNITWSDLEGNYQGEADGAGPTGEGLQWFSTVNGQSMYDWHTLHPYGKLAGDVPLRIRVAADYHWDWSWGRTTVGAIQSFDSGQHANQTRNIGASLVNPALGNLGQATANPFTQFHDAQRGTVIFNSQATTNVTIQQDFKVLPLGARGLRIFAKLVADNVFNHQQQISTQNQWETAQNGPDDPWVPGNTRLDRNNFGSARTYRVEAGLTF